MHGATPSDGDVLEKISDDEVAVAMRMMDIDGDDSVNQDEFVRAVASFAALIDFYTISVSLFCDRWEEGVCVGGGVSKEKMRNGLQELDRGGGGWGGMGNADGYIQRYEFVDKVAPNFPGRSKMTGEQATAHPSAPRPGGTDAQRSDARSVFELLDQDGSGALDDNEVQKVLDALDHDGNGVLDEHEFMVCWDGNGV